MTSSDCGIFDRRPHGGLATRLTNSLIPDLRKGRLTLVLPNGDRIERQGADPGPEARIEVRHWRGLLRLARQGDEGLVRGYIAGQIATPDIAPVLDLAVSNENVVESFTQRSAINSQIRRLAHALRANTRAGSRRNIRAHYDLGNDFFRLWLDSGMNYSSAIYAGNEDLETAQLRKLDRIVGMLRLRDGDRIIEIGCGWGALAERLLQHHDVRYTGITLSSEQLAYAKARLQRAYGADAATFRLEDYREFDGCFDRIASIEMIEAVGEQYWPVYFQKLRQALAKGGRAVIQAITIDENRFEAYRNRPDFIQRYIFPGGMLPTDRIVIEQASRAGLRLIERESFGNSYAKTLREWRARFRKAARDLEQLGFDSQFRRLWDYYLAYCEVGFLHASINVSLYAFAG
jgi:cyclopropane-fatty-acyl-phospholipid synthase